MPIPRPDHRRHVRVDAADPYGRGAARGEQLRAHLPAALDVYDRLFALGGITPARVRDDAERALDAVGEFRPGARAEIEGIAHGAGLDPWRVAALNARTEILAGSATVPPGECTTLVRRTTEPPGDTFDANDTGGTDGPAPAVRTFGVQTWDWHVELSAHWHTLESRGGRHTVVGLTEDGILGKIGINSAGLALHFNILGHVRDGVGGVPVHVLAAVVLAEAGSVAEAVDLVRGAPLASSGSFALFDGTDATLLDLSPAGVFAVAPDERGLLVRTNHFLTPVPAAEEKSWLYQPDSGDRHDFVRARLDRLRPLPDTSEALARCLVTGPGEPPVTCLPDPAEALGRRWASLATVTLDPATRTAAVLDGTPAELGVRPWRTLTAT
ncbi:C45 family peptidase [Kitasatospora purpeofusca]|uniref:C45 family autoproteolytic acyltransferase/hydolase n=1 Tax=Kitasatospora purpeofusca TaxID=67352 RepID=UPI0022589291|nr:C45 family peptidase [Kitasatospora purpeofusca]MCX4683435.1 C45 family peptidase [Kitasatospora purpeofusca]